MQIKTNKAIASGGASPQEEDKARMLFGNKLVVNMSHKCLFLCYNINLSYLVQLLFKILIIVLYFYKLHANFFLNLCKCFLFQQNEHRNSKRGILKFPK